MASQESGLSPLKAMPPSGPKPKRMVQSFGPSPRALTSVAMRPAASFDWMLEIEIDGDAGIEIDIVERRADGGARRGQRVAVIADRALEHERLAARAIHQIVEDLRIGGFGVGEVDPLHDSPGEPGGAALDAGGVPRPRIERFDGDAVIGLRPERSERRPLQRLFDERLPSRLVGGREIAGQGEFHHSRQAL